MSITNYGSYLICTRSDFRERAGVVIGQPGMTPAEAVAAEGDKVWFTAEEFVFVWRPSSRGPLRPGWLPGIQYVCKEIDGQTRALPMRDLYDKDWTGAASINTYGLS